MAMVPFVRTTPTPPTSRKRLAFVAALTVFAVATAVIVIPLARNSGASSEIAPDSIGIIDAESGEVISTLELETRPGAIAASADAVWLTNPDVDAVTRIDSTERAVVDSIPVGENPTGIAVGEGAVWVVESGGPSVSRISPGTGEVVDTIEVGNGPTDIAVGDGAVWVTNRFDGTVSRIDPSHVGAVETIPVGLEPRGVAIGFGSAWVALAGSNQVVRIDPGTNSVTHAISVGNAPGSLVVSTDAVWVANTLDDTVSQISPDTNSVVTTVPVGKSPSGIEVTGDGVWVANEADGTLSRIEPGQGPRTVVIESVPEDLVGVNGDLWVSVRGTATSHRGGTLRAVSAEPPVSLDPGAAYDFKDWRVLHLLGDGLLAFEPVGGTSGTLVPDLATSIPTSADGRTFTFEVRPGIRYSNGETVRPADFRRALERGFFVNTGAHRDLYGGLVGGESCGERPRTCDLSQGIETDNASGTITFHLVAPDPEFLYKLTLPFAYPVPPSTPDEEQVSAGVLGTGPYMLEAPMTSEGLTLVRNPQFHIWSQAQPEGYADRIEWTFGMEPEAQVDAVIGGEADLSFDASLSDRFEEILVRFSAQVHTSPDATTFFWPLNTREPPFDDVDVRRAINLALDRGRVVRIFGGETAARATCQQLPPNFPGYQPYCPYTMNAGPAGEGSWSAPDLEEAQQIVRRSGTAGMRVVIEYLEGCCPPAILDYMIELLDELGYRGSLRAVTNGEFYDPSNAFHMAPAGWAADYPAASNFVALLTCDSSQTPRSGFCDPDIDAMIQRANRVQLEDPAAAGALWADIDREIVDQAPYLWLVNPIHVAFVSERVGNYQFNPQWDSLLNQLWVR